ncbi:MAG: thiamine-phosphate kinase [Pseudomonadota bacterium]
MHRESLTKALRFYFITDDSVPDFPPADQARVAIRAGATMIQYRNKSFSPRFIEEVFSIRDLCKCNAVPFIINDNILLAKAVAADGIHLGQDDDDPALARSVLGDRAIVGKSVSTESELSKTDLSHCDYIGTGPVFSTKTKADAKKIIGLSGLEAVVRASPLPTVAIGGIDPANAESCFISGADGVAVISSVSRAKDPLQTALELSTACGIRPRERVEAPWTDEFLLIKKLLGNTRPYQNVSKDLKVPPGDDAALFSCIRNPVITTDTQKEGVHFRLDWQTPGEIGSRAVEITFSDLAASYAAPVSLFVNLSLPSHISERTVEELYAGIGTALENYGCTLGGGNISAGQELSLDLFAIGRGRDNQFPTRSAGRPGYGLYCTGSLGLARAGLECLIQKDTAFKKLIRKFKSPKARFDAAEVLAENGVACVMDISDGLAGDAGHIAEASQISIEFDLADCEFDPELRSFCEKYQKTPEEMVLSGGEDYELLFACLPDQFKAIKTAIPDAFRVGRCLSFTGEYLLNLPSNVSSFRHGKS